MIGIHRNFPAGGGDTSDATAEQWHIKSGRTAYIASGKVTGTGGYVHGRMGFGSTAAMSISSEDWSFSSGVTAVGMFVKTAHLNAGGFSRALFQCLGASGSQIDIYTISSDVASGTDRRNKLNFLVQSNTPSNLVNITSDDEVCDDALHSFLFSYNPSTGAAHLYIDDAENINEAGTNHALSSGTIGTGAGAKTLGARTIADRYWGETGGSIGYFGIANTFIDFSVETNRRKFFDSDGDPVTPDESTWSQWGGVTPYCWHPIGDLRNNRGSKSDFTDDSTTAANLIAVA